MTGSQGLVNWREVRVIRKSEILCLRAKIAVQSLYYLALQFATPRHTMY
jgi:hypothetical protein